MSDERRPVHRMEGKRANRRRGQRPRLARQGSAACLLLALLGLLRAAAPAGAISRLDVSPGASPERVDCGAVTAGQQATRQVTLRNAGTGPTGTIQIDGNLSGSEFSIQSSTVSPIAPGASTTWSLTFHPTTAGIVSGYVRFTDPLGGTGSTVVTVNVT